MTAAWVDTALRLSAEAHDGQRNALGRGYFASHVTRVVARACFDERNPAVRATAWLHDVVEDTEVTLEDLAAAGMPASVVEAVDAITRRPGEVYAAYIDRVRLNPIARIVKLADNAQNLADNDALALVDPVKAASLKRRYLAARERLEEAT